MNIPPRVQANYYPHSIFFVTEELTILVMKAQNQNQNLEMAKNAQSEARNGQKCPKTDEDGPK